MKYLDRTAFGAPTKTQDLLSLALSRALHKLDAQEASRGKVLNIVFLADSMEEDDSIDEAINALASELDKNTCKRLLRISDWF